MAGGETEVSLPSHGVEYPSSFLRDAPKQKASEHGRGQPVLLWSDCTAGGSCRNVWNRQQALLFLNICMPSLERNHVWREGSRMPRLCFDFAPHPHQFCLLLCLPSHPMRSLHNPRRMLTTLSSLFSLQRDLLRHIQLNKNLSSFLSFSHQEWHPLQAERLVFFFFK